MPSMGGFYFPGPPGRPSARLARRSEGSFSAQSHLPLEHSSPQVSLRGCQGFTCWLGSSPFLMKGHAGGVFVAYTAGRSEGPTVRPPRERPQTAVCQGTEALSYFMRKKTNKQIQRSKERGKKGNHGDHPKEPKTANTASRAVGRSALF